MHPFLETSFLLNKTISAACDISCNYGNFIGVLKTAKLNCFSGMKFNFLSIILHFPIKKLWPLSIPAQQRLFFDLPNVASLIY